MLFILIGIVIGLVIAFPLGVLYRKKVAEKEIASAEEEAKRIINESIKSAESKKREALVEAKEEILKAWKEFHGPAQDLNLPSAPKQFLHYFEENDRPQPKLDRMLENGMAVSIGRLREDNQYDYKFVCLSHNTLRGAAGGAVLLAELLAAKGYFD